MKLLPVMLLIASVFAVTLVVATWPIVPMIFEETRVERQIIAAMDEVPDLAFDFCYEAKCFYG